MLTLPKKIKLVRRMEKGESRSKLMAELGVGSSTLYDLKKQVKLLSFVASTDGPSAKIEKRKTLKGPKLGKLDKGLYLWFQARSSEGKAVSGPALIDEAKKLKDRLGIEEECDFSVGWLQNFKQRHGICRIKVQGRGVPLTPQQPIVSVKSFYPSLGNMGLHLNRCTMLTKHVIFKIK